jgi:hypothetical protein
MVASLVAVLVMTGLMLGWRVLMLPNVGGRLRVPRPGGVAVLRPPRGQNIMFAGLALAPTLILLAYLVKVDHLTRADQSGLVLGFTLLGLGGGTTLSLLAAEFRQRLRVDREHLESVFVLTTKRVRWSEVQRIRWNPASRWFFVAAAGAWLWVPIDLDGIGDFAELALAALPPAVLAASLETREALEELAATISRTA